MENCILTVVDLVVGRFGWREWSAELKKVAGGCKESEVLKSKWFVKE